MPEVILVGGQLNGGVSENLKPIFFIRFRKGMARRRE